MSHRSVPQLYIPNLGHVPVNVKYDLGRASEILIRPDETRRRFNEHKARKKELLSSLNPAIKKFRDPKSRTVSFAIEKQKIVVLTKSQLNALRNQRLQVVAVSGKRSKLLSSLSTKESHQRITVSDCPNPPDKQDGSAELTFTVLLEWTEKTGSSFPDLVLRDTTGQVQVVPEQTDNFFVVSGDPNNRPAPPIATVSGPLNTQPTDFKTITQEDLRHYKELAGKLDCKNPTVVAVVDTGLKFNFQNAGEPTLPEPYTYKDSQCECREFVLTYNKRVESECMAMQDDHIGYCALDAYKQQSFANLLSTEVPSIRNSPFDDNRIFSGPNFGNYLDGRHGTTISAIVQQKANVPILPVKAFDNLGFSTLFDILNALNYVLYYRLQTNEIVIVNASWIFERNEPLLEKKIRQLMDAGIFVIAAAGNRNQTKFRDLEKSPVYPAYYSKTYPNVITVTSVTKIYSLLSDGSKEATAPCAELEKVAGDRLQLIRSEDSLSINATALEGYVAVENFSNTIVNVGVVSTLGYFSSPFYDSSPVSGSSFACAHVSAFVAKKLCAAPPSWQGKPGPVAKQEIEKARQALLDAMTGKDPLLGQHEVADGCFLAI